MSVDLVAWLIVGGMLLLGLARYFWDARRLEREGWVRCRAPRMSSRPTAHYWKRPR